MKKLFTTIIFCFIAVIVIAQPGYITTIAGNGVLGFAGDGGPATAAEFQTPTGFCTDKFGNLIFADFDNNRIRKISVNGIISTIAGTGVAGYLGDGGPATLAQLYAPQDVVTKSNGEFLIADYFNRRIRKIDSMGIITSIAGTGSSTYSGDGGPATDAGIGDVYCIAIDQIGNVVFTDKLNSRIRKIDSNGIISTIAGIGIGGFNGDGGAATAASINAPRGIIVDHYGNIIFADYGNYRIRKINNLGIITTIAGIGSTGTTADSIPAIFAYIGTPIFLTTDVAGNIYFNSANKIRKISQLGIITTSAGVTSGGLSGDGIPATAAYINTLCVSYCNNSLMLEHTGTKIRKVELMPGYFSDSFNVTVGNSCKGIEFSLVTSSYSVGHHIKTYFGDGTTFDSATTPIGSFGSLNIFKTVPSSGVYTIKHVLYYGSTIIDSITYSHTITLCENFNFKFYYDTVGTCTYDSSSVLNHFPVTLEVDSNGIVIDTVSALGELYYKAYGNPGDTYAFKVIDHPSSLVFVCPSTGIITDTFIIDNPKTQYFGINCSSTGTGFDLSQNRLTYTGRHAQQSLFTVKNSYCNSENATFTMNFSTKYNFYSANIPPTTVAGNVATWHLGYLNNLNLINLSVHLEVPSTWLLPGDTANMDCIVDPTIGDVDTTNNIIIASDTVRSSFDPNEMMVNPSGVVPPGVVTQLQYGILFENTGNDTAQNIYIMDTLSDNVDVHSMRMVTASAAMSTLRYTAGGHNILKFDFAGIKLPDSSHHNQCDGMVIFTIKTKPGLPLGTTIYNHAGIYFDDNPVVTTDTVLDIVANPVVVADIKRNNVRIFPNPATSELTVQTTGSGYSSLIITNCIGETVLSQTLQNNNEVIDIHSLPGGLYFVKLSGEAGTEMKLFVKQ